MRENLADISENFLKEKQGKFDRKSAKKIE